jgi:hypothetical protein
MSAASGLAKGVTPGALRDAAGFTAADGTGRETPREPVGSFDLSAEPDSLNMSIPFNNLFGFVATCRQNLR